MDRPFSPLGTLNSPPRLTSSSAPHVLPSRYQQSPVYDAATEAQLDQWIEAKRAKDFATSDMLRDQLRARGVNPDQARPPIR